MRRDFFSRRAIPAPLAAAACVLIAAGSAANADAWKMDGVKHVTLHTVDGKAIPIGTVDFTPTTGDQTTFKLHIDPKPFTTYFLSMRNFQCLEGPDVECFVPYPYDNPMTASPKDLNWLADNLLFLFKTKSQHAAYMTNGIRYDLKLTDHGIVGTPQAIDLDDIASPPKDPKAAPYGPSDRDDYPDGSRWVKDITIE